MCLSSVNWAESDHHTPDGLLSAMAKRRSVRAQYGGAASQEALDVILACAQSGRSAKPALRARHHNWVWNKRDTPELPDVSLEPTLATDLGLSRTKTAEELSEAAKLLLYEWPLGADVRDYSYTNPYSGLDLDMPTVSASQPEQRGMRAVPQVSSQREVPPVTSQRDLAPQSSQDEPFKGVQSQTVSGRFGQRAPPPKRRKRMGGF